MSDVFPSPLPEPHKTELLANTSSLSYGSGMATNSGEIGLSSASGGSSTDTALFPGGKSYEAGTQLDSVQAKAIPTNDLVAQLAISATTSGSGPSSAGSDIIRPNIMAGHAMAELLANSDNASAPASSKEAGTLRKLQFLSEETAIRTVAALVTPHGNAVETTFAVTPQATSGTNLGISIPAGGTATSLLDVEENQHVSDPTPHSRATRSTFYEYDSSNNSFNGNYDFTPGGVINDTATVDWNYWGGGGGGVVVIVPRLRTHSQNMTVAARHMAEKKTAGHLS